MPRILHAITHALTAWRRPTLDAREQRQRQRFVRAMSGGR